MHRIDLTYPEWYAFYFKNLPAKEKQRFCGCPYIFVSVSDEHIKEDEYERPFFIWCAVQDNDDLDICNMQWRFNDAEDFYDHKEILLKWFKQYAHDLRRNDELKNMSACAPLPEKRFFYDWQQEA